MSKENVILWPEAGHSVVDEIGSNHGTGYEVWVTDMGLDESITMVAKGEVGAMIAGALHTSADVVRKSKAILGHKGLISSWFGMEVPGTERDHSDTLFFTDCAVIPTQNPENLAISATDACENMGKLGVEAVVGFLDVEQGSDLVKNAVDLFMSNNPDIPTVGSIKWSEFRNEARFQDRTGRQFPEGRQPNLLVFPTLHSGNNGYKTVQEADSGGHTLVESNQDRHVLERDGNHIYLSNTQFEQPSLRGLISAAEKAIQGVEDPVVGFLSFSTYGSSKTREANLVAAASEIFSILHPKVTNLRDLQRDALSEDVYEKKSKRRYPDGRSANVWIAPDMYTTSFLLDAMQNTDAAMMGRVAVGPMLQGLNGPVYDASRNIDCVAARRIVANVGALNGLERQELPLAA